MTKRLISFLLVLCMLLTWLPISHAEETSYVVPEGAVEFCGNDYMVFNDSMTRTEAAAKCAEMGGRLVTITSQAENNFVVELLANAEKNCYWIGIEYDMDNGLWKLDDSEHTIAPYFNWAPNEPNFFGDQDEPYVHMFGKRHTGGNGLKEVGQWNDVSNEGAVYAHSFYDLKNFGYICEWGEEKIVDLGDYIMFDGHSYQIYNHCATWNDAKKFCEELGGYLATISSKKENEYLHHFIQTRGVSEAYFGYTDEADEGNWGWVKEEDSNYTNWHTGEPSNSGNKEHYGMFYKDFKDGTWNDGEFPSTAVWFICEWDKILTNEDLLPTRDIPLGYNFDEDSLDFKNYTINEISYNYFESIYEKAAAKIVYNEKRTASNEGVCFGMTCATGSIFNGYPSVSSCYNKYGPLKSYCKNIRDLKKSSTIKIGEMEISLNDYIKYAFIYQWSTTNTELRDDNQKDPDKLISAIQDAIVNEQINVNVSFEHYIYNSATQEMDFHCAHSVLAVGANGNIIYIDDPNHKDSLQELEILEDGQWTYHGDNEYYCTNGLVFEQTLISFSPDVTMPYHILLTGRTTATVIDDPSTLSTEEAIPETYIEGMERLDADKMLLSVESDSYQLANTDICQITKDSAAETADLFWISNDDTITLSGLEGESTVRLASDDLLIGVETGSGGDVTMTNTGTTSDITLSTAAGDSCTFTVETTGTNEEDVILVVSGTAADTTITLHQNDSQVTVDGLENGTVSVYEDEQPVREEPLPQDGGEIDIVYDPTGETDDLEISGTVNPFTDVPADSFYYDPVLWALENGITTGATATTFDPNGSCLRAHVVTFLHRAAKNPEPTATNNPFTDVKTTDFFYKPVLWAVEKSITNGVSATEFGSFANCNRAAVVTFLWRAAGQPEPTATENPFTDVKTGDFFYKAVLWAVENGITNGVDATHFGPTAACNRAQVVTFLYRAYN